MPETLDGVTSGDDPEPHAVALSVAGLMRTFGSGEMAALRRLDEDAAVPAFWRLAARNPILADPARGGKRRTWVAIVQALAILMPKGPPEDRGDLHDPKRKFGAALCDGGRLDWPGGLAPGVAPRPLLSEGRLAQLLAARGRQRSVLMLRAVRSLAASRDAGVGLDVGDLAWRFLDPASERLAMPYYIRLDRAAVQAKPERTPDA